MYRLISANPSPYARKVRVALHEKGIPFTLQTEVPWDAATTLSAQNPLGKLPVLLPPDAPPVYESRFILEWLEVRHPDPPLLPTDPEQRLAARQVEVIGDGVLDAFLLLFFERLRPAPLRSDPWMARQQRKIDGGLRALAALAEALEGRWLVGERFGLADLAAGCALGYLALRYPELPWRERHPALAALSDRLETRSSFAASVPTPQVFADRVV